MRHFFGTLVRVSRSLFPRLQDKMLLLSLTLLGALISISELGIAKIFTSIVLEEKPATIGPIAIILLFLVLSLAARLSTYFQRTQRIRIFSKSIYATKFKNKENSWNYSLAMEISNIFSYLLQIVIVNIFLVYLSVEIGLITLIAASTVIGIFGSFFTTQEEFQKSAFRARYKSETFSTETLVFNRVKSGELGALIAGLVAVVLLLFLLIGHELNLISTAGAVVSFFAIRLLSSNLNSLSSSLMRFARALVNSSISTVKDTKNSPNNEILAGWDQA